MTEYGLAFGTTARGGGFVLLELLAAGPSGAGAFVDVASYLEDGEDLSVDAQPATQRAIDDLRGTGTALWFPARVYRFKLGLVNFSNLIIWSAPGAVFWADLDTTHGFNPESCLFSALPQYGTSSTTSAIVAAGAQVLPLASAAGMVVGESILITDVTQPLQGASYVIRKIVGNNVTVDRPLAFTYGANSPVTVITRLENFTLYGNGLVISGTGTRYFEMASALHCTVDGINFDNSKGRNNEVAGSFDTGSFDCFWTNCHSNQAAAVVIEGGENCYIKECIWEADVASVAEAGFTINDSAYCGIIDSHGSGATGNGGFNWGALLSSEFGLPGCIGCFVRGGTYPNPSGCGVIVSGGGGAGESSGNKVTSVNCDNCAIGIDIEASVRAFIVDCTARNCQEGLRASGASIVDISGLDITGYLNIGIDVSATRMMARGVVSKGVAAQSGTSLLGGGCGLQANNASVVDLVSSDLTNDRSKNATTQLLVVSANGSRVRISHSGFHLTSTNATSAQFGLVCGVGSFMHARDVNIDAPLGAANPTAIVVAATGTFRGEGGITQQNVANNFAAGSFVSPGTCTGNVAVPWPDLQPDDQVLAICSTGAVVGGMTMVPGTGFTVIDATGATFDYVVT